MPRLSSYKFKRIATEALKNSLRLHFDSILLHSHGSYPSAFQLSILAIEEFGKALWVEHYYSTAITNSGFPDEQFEQEWLQLLYRHPEKQGFFFSRDVFSYSPTWIQFISDRGLELQKQEATYVGLRRAGRKIDTAARVSTPNRIKRSDSTQLISLLNAEFLQCYRRKIDEEGHFEIGEMDAVLNRGVAKRLRNWRHKTNIKSKRWWKSWKKQFASIDGRRP